MIVETILAVVTTFVAAFWIMVPAYVANAGAVPFGGGTPVDFGKCAKDGRRYLGDGKTWRGLIGGIVVGILFGLLQIFLAQTFHWDWLPEQTIVTITALASCSLCLAVDCCKHDHLDLYCNSHLDTASPPRGKHYRIPDRYQTGSLVTGISGYPYFTEVRAPTDQEM